MKNLALRALGRLLVLVISLAALLFLPAGTLDYWQAWVFLVVFALSLLGVTLYLMKTNPKLLERRLNSRHKTETGGVRKLIHFLASQALLLTVLIPAIDHRCHWSTVPIYFVLGGDVLVVLGFLLVIAVFKENAFASAIIEVVEGQKIVASGPYAVVRHPMYLGLLVTFAGISPALGSWWALLTVIPLALVLTLRLLDEESFLAGNMPGYAAYRDRVRYRLVPLVW